MKGIIIEDEQASQKYLLNILGQHFPALEIVTVADNVPEAVAAIKQYMPDFVYLDVEIKLGTGFDVLEQTRGLCYETIFTTAFNTFALEAFRYHAVDYLLKPLNDTQIIETTERCVARISNNKKDKRLDELLQYLQRPALEQKPKLGVPTVEGIEFIVVQDIVYGEAKGNYTNLWLQNGTRVTVSRKLKEMEQTLPVHLFFRIHHSYIVNLQYVTKYHKGRGGYLVLYNDISLPVSSVKRDEFLNWLQ